MTTFKVYHYRRDLDTKITCSLGLSHQVTYHEVKKITQTDTRTEFIPWLYYDHGGMGEILIAVDYQGRIYESKPTYDGYISWVRDDGKVFFNRPALIMDAALSLDGSRIYPSKNGERHDTR